MQVKESNSQSKLPYAVAADSDRRSNGEFDCEFTFDSHEWSWSGMVAVHDNGNEGASEGAKSTRQACDEEGRREGRR